MVINNLNICNTITSTPAKTNTPLFINSDAVLTLSITFQQFQMVTRW